MKKLYNCESANPQQELALFALSCVCMTMKNFYRSFSGFIAQTEDLSLNLAIYRSSQPLYRSNRVQ
jgi:hypothetical protein